MESIGAIRVPCPGHDLSYVILTCVPCQCIYGATLETGSRTTVSIQQFFSPVILNVPRKRKTNIVAPVVMFPNFLKEIVYKYFGNFYTKFSCVYIGSRFVLLLSTPLPLCAWCAVRNV